MKTPCEENQILSEIFKSVNWPKKQFRFDGDIIEGSKSLQDLEIESGDIIEVLS